VSRAALRVALLLVVLGAAGCALFGASDEPVPAGILATPGERFTITVPANHSTGFAWHLGRPLDEAVVTLVETTYDTPPGAAPGTAGEELWTFEAVAPGWARIELLYRRPWEDNLAPARIATYSVDVR